MARKRYLDDITVDTEPKKIKVSENISIHMAAKTGNLEIVRKHLISGTNPNTKNNDNQTPLDLAMLKNHLEIVQELMKYGADVNLKYDTGETPLHLTSHYGLLEIAKLLLDHGALVNTADDCNQESPLHYAVNACYDDDRLVLELLKHGADSNAKNIAGRTPLHKAVVDEGKISLIKTLAQYGAIIDSLDKEGYTPLHLVIWMIKQYQIEDQEYIEVIRELLRIGANPNVANNQGDTPLHTAALCGSVTIVTELLRNGADVHAITDENQYTPLFYAVMKDDDNHLHGTVENHIEIVRLLLQFGAKIDALNTSGDTPLHHAQDTIEFVSYLLKQGANPDVQNCEFNQTILHEVSESKFPKIVKLLLEDGAEVNLASFEGTPLHHAISKEYVENYSTQEILEVVTLLLQNGANVNAINRKGLTPLHMAVDSPTIISKLLEYCPDVNIQDSKGRTPIHLALTSDLPVSKVVETVTIILEKGKNINFYLEHKGLMILETAKKNKFKKIERMILKKMCPNPKISDSIYPLKYLL